VAAALSPRLVKRTRSTAAQHGVTSPRHVTSPKQHLHSTTAHRQSLAKARTTRAPPPAGYCLPVGCRDGAGGDCARSLALKQRSDASMSGSSSAVQGETTSLTFSCSLAGMDVGVLAAMSGTSSSPPRATNSCHLEWRSSCGRHTAASQSQPQSRPVYSQKDAAALSHCYTTPQLSRCHTAAQPRCHDSTVPRYHAVTL
jgi:hypothetical protein